MKRLFFAIVGLSAAAVAQAQVTAVVGHFAPFSGSIEETAVDVEVNGALLLEDVVFGQFSNRVELGDAGAYTVEVFPAGSNDAAISLTAELAEGDYSLLAIGDSVNQPLELLALDDATDAPEAGNVKVRVVHAAPFDTDIDSTLVSIRTDGGDVVGGLDSVPYKASSDFLELPVGTYNLKVSSPDGNTNFIDAAPFAATEGAVVTIVATGNGSLQPLGLTALSVGSLPLEIPSDLTANGIFTLDTNGQGMQVQVYPRQDRLLGFIYTFDVNGTNQEWIHFDSCNSDAGEAECASPGSYDVNGTPVSFYRSTGGIFNSDLQDATLTAQGTGVISLLDCDTLLLQGNLGNGAGEVALEFSRLGDRLSCFTE